MMMNKLAKISLLIPAFFIIMTAYAFAAFIEYHIIPLSVPFKLFLSGVAMVAAGQFIRCYFIE
jgi:hypothetical protein